MRQIWIRRPGDVDVLDIAEADAPEPGPGEVRISVKAVGINFADLMARMGMYADAPKLPAVVGYEVAGVIDTCGPQVQGCVEGERVAALTRFGGYATEVCVPDVQVFPLPPTMSFEDAAAIPVNYFTAYLALYHFGNLQDGERVLIHNAGGGVGLAAVQLARLTESTVIGTASAGKHARLSELGVDCCIDYRSADVVEEVSRATDGGGVHLILDPLGGPSLKADYRMLAPLGRIVAYGASKVVGAGRRRSIPRALGILLRMPRFSPVALMNDNAGVMGLNLGHLWGDIDRLRGMGERIFELVADGRITPKAGHSFPFEQVREAHRFIHDRKNTGKVVLTVE
ncbi:MAG: synaptic vesicle VAT-1 family membrane protein [Spirochaetaceae bacterium]